MSSLESNDRKSSRVPDEAWQSSYPPPAIPLGSGGPSTALVLTGLVALGLGIMAWEYLGPDLRRYLKIKSM